MQKWRPEYPVPLWHYVWLCAIMALTRFLILRKSWEEMVHFLLSRAGELNFHFSMFLIVKISKIKFLFSSQNSWFWRKFLFSNEWDFEENFSFSSRMNEILQTDSLSLLEIQNFERKNQFLLLILPSISLPILVRTRKPLSTTWRICRRRLATMISRRLTLI